MSVLSFLIPVTIAMGLVGLCAFAWSLKSGQYDDLEGDAARILNPDEDRPLGSSDVRPNGEDRP